MQCTGLGARRSSTTSGYTSYHAPGLTIANIVHSPDTRRSILILSAVKGNAQTSGQQTEKQKYNTALSNGIGLVITLNLVYQNFSQLDIYHLHSRLSSLRMNPALSS